MEKIFKIEKNKNLIVTSDFISISRNRFKDYAEMKEKSEMISQKKSFQIIKRKDVHKLTFKEKGSTIKLNYASEINANENINLSPSDKSELKELADSIGNRFEMQLNEIEESKAKYLTINSLKILVVLVFSYILVNASVSMQNGAEYEFSGRRQGSSRLFMSFIETIGPFGTSIICVLVLGFYIYKLIKRFKNPAKEYEYKKIIKKTT
jgi:hypothetical protein